jgi:hypothetical protein
MKPDSSRKTEVVLRLSAFFLDAGNPRGARARSLIALSGARIGFLGGPAESLDEDLPNVIHMVIDSKVLLDQELHSWASPQIVLPPVGSRTF